MPKSEQQNKAIRDSRKEQILSAAMRVFARYGMGATKISVIAKEAGLSHGLVYHYFSSKEEIFTTLVKKASESSIQVVQNAMSRQGTALDKLHWMTEEIIQSMDDGESPLLFLIMIQASTSEAVPSEVRDILSGEGSVSPVSATVPLIIEGQLAGEFVQTDAVTLAVTYFAFIQGLAINKLQWNDCPLPDADVIMKIFKENSNATKHKQ